MFLLLLKSTNWILYSSKFSFWPKGRICKYIYIYIYIFFFVKCLTVALVTQAMQFFSEKISRMLSNSQNFCSVKFSDIQYWHCMYTSNSIHWVCGTLMSRFSINCPCPLSQVPWCPMICGPKYNSCIMQTHATMYCKYYQLQVLYTCPMGVLGTS